MHSLNVWFSELIQSHVHVHRKASHVTSGLSHDDMQLWCLLKTIKRCWFSPIGNTQAGAATALLAHTSESICGVECCPDTLLSRILRCGILSSVVCFLCLFKQTCHQSATLFNWGLPNFCNPKCNFECSCPLFFLSIVLIMCLCICLPLSRSHSNINCQQPRCNYGYSFVWYS